jgi:hypothetical protein
MIAKVGLKKFLWFILISMLTIFVNYQLIPTLIDFVTLPRVIFSSNRPILLLSDLILMGAGCFLTWYGFRKLGQLLSSSHKETSPLWVSISIFLYLNIFFWGFSVLYIKLFGLLEGLFIFFVSKLAFLNPRC